MSNYYIPILVIFIFLIVLLNLIKPEKNQLEKYNSSKFQNKKFKSTNTEVYDKFVISNSNGDLKTIGCPKGVIWLWSGTIETVPEGWALCNGENNTPDLRGRFVLGVNPNSKRNTNFMVNEMNATGGKEKALLKHKHQYYQNASEDDPGNPGRINIKYQNGGNETSSLIFDSGKMTTKSNTDGYKATPDTSEVGDENTMPPYYTLAYIMKIV